MPPLVYVRRAHRWRNVSMKERGETVASPIATESAGFHQFRYQQVHIRTA